MKENFNIRHRAEHVVVDIPGRLRPDEIERLNAAAARAQARRTSLDDLSDDEVERARDRVSKVLTMRRNREEQFGSLLFSDPSWDLLLTLFVHRIDGQPMSVSSACSCTGAPPSTAFRHLSILIEQGWVTRHASATDRDVFYVELGNDAVERMVTMLGYV